MTIFTDNLAKLIEEDESVSASAARIGINRTQFNRYRSGEALPQPEALTRICRAYGVDERILSVPLADLAAEKALIRQCARERAMAMDLLGELREVVDGSEGVAGFHMNGDMATWEELNLSVDQIDLAICGKVAISAEAAG